MASAGNRPSAVCGVSNETDSREGQDAAVNDSVHPYGRWHKYVKPRVGQMFQVDKKVLRSLSIHSQEETDSERSSSAPPSGGLTESTRPAAGRRGRPARGREAAVRLNETLGVKAAHRVAAAASQRIVPERGGLCVHRPHTDGVYCEKDEFLEFSRNIIMQTPAWNSPGAFASLEQRWKDNVADKFGGPAYRRSGSVSSTGSGRKRGRKRKVNESDDDASGAAASSSEKEDDDLSKSSSMEVTPRTDALFPSAPSIAQIHERKKVHSLEEDEAMLSYLQSIHKGNCDVAKFSMLSDLSMGRAVQARRHLKKRRKEEEMEAPLSDMLYPSESWRRRYERSCSAMRGDVKNRPGLGKYSYFTGDGVSEFIQGVGVDAGKCASLEATVDKQVLGGSEELKQTWRSVLECAEDIVDRTSGNGTGRAKPTLRDLLTLMGKAHTLMRPEEVFGKRDTSVKRISQCMNVIVDQVVTARNVLAKLFDIVYDEKDEGIELDVLEKYIENVEAKSSIVVEETATVRKMVNEASQWETRLDHVLRPDQSDSSSLSESFDRNNVLAAVEQLASDARVLSLRPRSLVLLEARIEKARVLRNRIRDMRQSENREGSENKKLIASLVREANKVDLIFPELTMLTEVHEAAQGWTDRAAIAVRSRISLSELEDLVDRGDTMPVNLSDLLEKLRSRVAQANSWKSRLQEKVRAVGEDGLAIHLDETKWLDLIRKALSGDESRATEVQDLAVEGSRIPVDIPELRLLQVEVDARNWSLRAKKMLERKGKIEDLREHLMRGEAIRDKVPLDSVKEAAWVLDFEKDLAAVVESSDAWYRKYQPYLDGDNRRADGRCRISITLLRKIVAEGNSINANLGNASVKMNRILSQAEVWFNEYKPLLASFRIVTSSENNSLSTPTACAVKMDAVNVALEKGSELSVDLEEAMQLKVLAEKSQKWFSRALAIAPKRSKRNARGKKKVNREKHSLGELLSLVQEASEVPIDISDDLERLQMQLTEVQSWRLQAQCELKSISAAFGKLQSERLAYYGAPDLHTDKVASDQKLAVLEPVDSNNQSPQQKVSKASEGLKVHRMIGNLVKSVHSIGIYTVEEGIAEMLSKISKWCTKTAMMIAAPGQMFEKRYFKDLDNLIAEGEALLQEGKEDDTGAEQLEDSSLPLELKSNWTQLVSDDKTRLEKCREHRDEFISWCKATEAILSATDKKIPIETLRELGKQSLIYPKGAETVKRVQTILHEANAWIETTSEIVNSGQKISLEDAKVRVAKGENLNINCPEFRNLRNALRISRGWQLRVKRSKLDSGQSQISDIKDLIEEHSKFLVCMPDEIKKLKEALQGYCLCRKPYEGFMVGCDTCEEWFHGPCIGVSESQAERYDKYVCVRCVISKLFKGCAETTVQAIRKWTNSKDLTKARQIDGQRHQRKVREKRREIEKLKTEIEALKLKLNEKNGNAPDPVLEDMGRDLTSQSVGEAAETTGVNASLQHVIAREALSSERQNNETVPSTSPAIGDSNISKNKIPETMQSCKVSNIAASDNGTPLDGEKEHTSSQESNPKSTDMTHETQEKLNKALATLENCHRRMDQLGEIFNERKSREAREDIMRESLRRWFILVRTLVLVPKSIEQAKSSQPLKDGSLSPPMDQVVTEATKLGIRHLPDVSLTINAFGCMAWSLRALHVLSRKPKIEEVRSLVSQSEGAFFKLPETKCVRMLQSPLSRATLWQAKVVKALKPIPGEKKPYEVSVLSGLLGGARDIPYTMPEESQLWSTIEDEGNRHCLCGGPSDGRFMISCDKCEVWYHGDCVDFKAQGDAQSNWICPLCTGALTLKTWMLQRRDKIPETRAASSGGKDHDPASEDDVSPYAPDVDDLWPPFGLLETTAAMTALGISDPSDCEDVDASTPMASVNVTDSAAHPPKHLNKITPACAFPNVVTGVTAEITATRQQIKKLESANVVVDSRTALLPPGSQPKNQGTCNHGRVAGITMDGTSELSRAVQRAMQERERYSQSAQVSTSGSVPVSNTMSGSVGPSHSRSESAEPLSAGSRGAQAPHARSLESSNSRSAQPSRARNENIDSLHGSVRPANARSGSIRPALATNGSVQQAHAHLMAQGRQSLPQAVATPSNGPSQHSLQLILGGGLPQSMGNARREAVQVTQAMHLVAQSLKRPANDSVQASQAMQLLNHRRDTLPKGAKIPSNASRASHTLGISQQAMDARVPGGPFQSQPMTQPMHLIQGIERLPQQVPGSGMRAPMQPSATMQLIQKVSQQETFFQQNSSTLGSSAAVESAKEKRSGLDMASINNDHRSLPTQAASNGLSNQQGVPMQSLPATAPVSMQEQVGGIYATASSVPVPAGQRSQSQNPLLPSAAIGVPNNNYTIEKQQR